VILRYIEILTYWNIEILIYFDMLIYIDVTSSLCTHFEFTHYKSTLQSKSYLQYSSHLAPEEEENIVCIRRLSGRHSIIVIILRSLASISHPLQNYPVYIALLIGENLISITKTELISFFTEMIKSSWEWSAKWQFFARIRILSHLHLEALRTNNKNYIPCLDLAQNLALRLS